MSSLPPTTLLGCLEVELVSREVKFVHQNGAKFTLAISHSMLFDPFIVLPGKVYEWNNNFLDPEFSLSEATWDQLVDCMPPYRRELFRHRLCIECALVVDLCRCGCCREGISD